MLSKILKKILKAFGLFVLLIIAVIAASYINNPTKEEREQKAEREEMDRRLDVLIDSCDVRIKLAVINKSTLDIAVFGNKKWKGEDGKYYVTRKFTAKNKFNLEQKFRAFCSEDENGKIEFDINEVIAGG